MHCFGFIRLCMYCFHFQPVTPVPHLVLLCSLFTGKERLVRLQEGMPHKAQPSCQGQLYCNITGMHACINFFTAHVISESTKQRDWYLLCDETVESEYKQQSSTDGGNDEAKLVQVFDWSSLRSLH